MHTFLAVVYGIRCPARKRSLTLGPLTVRLAPLRVPTDIIASMTTDEIFRAVTARGHEWGNASISHDGKLQYVIDNIPVTQAQAEQIANGELNPTDLVIDSE